MNIDINSLNAMRKAQNFMTIDEVIKLSESGNMVFDPFSVLISKYIQIGKNNIFYPNILLISNDFSDLKISDRNIFHSNTFLEVTNGKIIIGSGNQFGEGGFTAKANRPNSSIEIGDNGRYINGASVFGETYLGSGSQLLGQIVVDSCYLESGESWKSTNINQRAGLLKGFGTAKNIRVSQGRVINGNGIFDSSQTEEQINYHKY